MKQTYRALAGLIALGVLVQAASVAFGWFQAISEIEGGLVVDQNYEGNAGHAIHGFLGFNVLPALALILLIVSFFAKEVPGARKWAGVTLGLVVLQVVLAILAFAVAPVIGALHGLNALLVFGAAVMAMLATRSKVAAPTRPEGASLAV